MEPFGGTSRKLIEIEEFVDFEIHATSSGSHSIRSFTKSNGNSPKFLYKK